MNHWWIVGGAALLLFGLAFMVPSNNLTGHIVQEGTCKGIGCVELCDIEAAGTASTCGTGLTCCATQWNSGVCDYETNCESIREYSFYQSIETYQDSVREQPAAVELDIQRFFLPLLITLGIVAYFITKRNDPVSEVR